MTTDLDWTIDPTPRQLHINGYRVPLPTRAKPPPSRAQPGVKTWPYRTPNPPAASAVPRLRTVRVLTSQATMPAGTVLRAIEARHGYGRRLRHGARSQALGLLLAAAALFGLVVLAVCVVLVLLVGVAGVGAVWTWVGR